MNGLSALEQVMLGPSVVLHDEAGWCTIIIPGQGDAPDIEIRAKTDEAAAQAALAALALAEKKKRR